MNFIDWLQNVTVYGFGKTCHRFYGIYAAVVTDNKDPEGLGRVQAVCTQVGQHEALDVWIRPALTGAGNKRGTFFPPEVDDTVWVSFYEGDPSHPQLYFGGWFGKPDGESDVPTLLKQTGEYPEKKGWVSRAGHAHVMNDEDGNEAHLLLWNKPKSDDPARTDRRKTAEVNPDANGVMGFDKNGSFTIKTPSSYIFQFNEPNKSVTIMTPEGTTFQINKEDDVSLTHKSGAFLAIGKTVELAGTSSMDVNITGGNVNINGGGVLVGGKAIDFAVLGLKLIKWLALHVHPTALGPSLPPMIPPTPADFCSKSVKVQD